MAKSLQILFLVVCGGTAVAILMLAAAAWPPRFGVGLGGGIRLRFKVDSDLPAEINPHALAAVHLRVDPTRSKDVRVRADGEQLDIVIPMHEEAAIERIRASLEHIGLLEFRIVADAQRHDALLRLADAPEHQHSEILRDGPRIIGRWCRVGRDETRPEVLKISIDDAVVRDAKTHERIALPREAVHGDEHAVERWLASQGIRDVDVLVSMEDGFDVTGSDLQSVSAAADEMLRPCLRFAMCPEGAERFAGLTSKYQPDHATGFAWKLGIVLDGVLLSAPRLMSPIHGHGQITGRFTDREVEDLVNILRCGALPFHLHEITRTTTELVPAEASQVRAAVGWSLGTAIALALLGLFLLGRYGVLGCGAATLSLLHVSLVLGVVELLGVTVTVPFVIAAGLTLLFVAVGQALVCRVLNAWIHREGHLSRGSWMGVALYGLAGLLSGCVAALLCIAGRFAAQNIGLAMTLTGVVGLPTTVIGFAILAGLAVIGRTNGSPRMAEQDPGTRQDAGNTPP